MLADLRHGILPMDDSEMDAVEAWAWYKGLAAFEPVCFEQFEAQLEAHRKQVKADNHNIDVAAAAFDHDMKLRTQATHNHNGRPLFCRSDAQPLLEEDVVNKKHIGLDPDEFRHTRQEYMNWTLNEFRPRIYQEERRQRWFNYMKHKREEKQAKDKRRWANQKAKRDTKEAAELKAKLSEERKTKRAKEKAEKRADHMDVA